MDMLERKAVESGEKEEIREENTGQQATENKGEAQEKGDDIQPAEEKKIQETGALQEEREEEVTKPEASGDNTAPQMQTDDGNPGQTDEETIPPQDPGETAGEEATAPEITVDAETPAEEPEKTESREPEEPVSDEATESVEEEDGNIMKEVDYSTFGIGELLNRLELLIDERPVQEIRHDVESIKINFYKKFHLEIEEKKKRFLEEGGDPLDFKPGPDEREEHLKYLLKKFRDKKAKYNKELEEEKKRNLEEKYRIIEEIGDLVNRKESINKTFQEFRELQERWRNVGLVPQQHVKDLWENYHYHVEKFYDYIKINKELRDLDLKKNLEKKIKLCEQAESLLLEPDIISAFKTLQKYHEQWRETGPVPKENKTELWERFKEATRKINKKYQAYFQEIKEIQKKNLEQKTSLAERAEEIADLEIRSHRQWDEKSREIQELQKVWKTIGFAPRKQNNAIYERFRKACDRFFNRKREYYAENKEVQMNNLQMKTDLCIQAEALKDSTEWQKTTEDLINLQKKWKEIGPVPKKYSDQIWKRFRAACDVFFENKSRYFRDREKNYQENLKMKEELIEEIRNFKMTDDPDADFNKLNEFQRRWTEIGYVPISKKEEIANAYREAINNLFNNLNINDHKKNLLKYKAKIEALGSTSRANIKLQKDREKFINRIKQLENDITVWENNIGFFTQSKNAESLIKDITTKIENAKASIKLLKDKIRLIDEMEND